MKIQSAKQIRIKFPVDLNENLVSSTSNLVLKVPLLPVPQQLNQKEENPEVELSGQSPKVKHKCKKKKRRQKKEKLDIQSNSSGGTSSSERETSTEGEEFSDDEHAFLITSVDNLKRREIMNLQPLRTKSKEAP